MRKMIFISTLLSAVFWVSTASATGVSKTQCWLLASDATVVSLDRPDGGRLRVMRAFRNAFRFLLLDPPSIRLNAPIDFGDAGIAQAIVRPVSAKAANHSAIDLIQAQVRAARIPLALHAKDSSAIEVKIEIDYFSEGVLRASIQLGNQKIELRNFHIHRPFSKSPAGDFLASAVSGFDLLYDPTKLRAEIIGLFKKVDLLQSELQKNSSNQERLPHLTEVLKRLHLAFVGLEVGPRENVFNHLISAKKLLLDLLLSSKSGQEAMPEKTDPDLLTMIGHAWFVPQGSQNPLSPWMIFNALQNSETDLFSELDFTIDSGNEIPDELVKGIRNDRPRDKNLIDDSSGDSTSSDEEWAIQQVIRQVNQNNLGF